MKQVLVKRIVKLMVAAFVAVAVLVPVRAQAITYDQIQIVLIQSTQLCDADPSVTHWCSVEQAFSAVAPHITRQTPQNVIDSQLAGFDTDNTVAELNTVYEVFQRTGEVNPPVSHDGSGSADTNGNCADGEVKVAIPVTGSRECVGSVSNPIYEYLRGIIIFLGAAIGLAVVVTIIIAGIQYSSSNGNPQNIAKAKERLLNAVIGLLLYLFLAAILRFLVPQIFT